MITAGTYTTLATFGASLTDWGGMYGLTKDVIRVPLPLAKNGYSLGYSNGPVYTVYAQDLLEIPTLENYAVGSAAALGVSVLEDFLIEKRVAYTIKVDADDPRLQVDLNYSAQVDRFLQANLGEDLSQTMSLIQMGLVDYMNFFPSVSRDGTTSYEEFTQEVTGVVFDGVDAMFDAGVGAVVLNTLPDPSNFLFMNWFPKFYLRQVDGAVAYHNAMLKAEVTARAREGQDIQVVDMNALTAAIHDDPTAFGFSAPEDAYILETGFWGIISYPILDSFDADQVMFYDPFHPSTAYHGVMGAFQAESLAKTTTILTSNQAPFSGTTSDDMILVRVVGSEVMSLGGDDTVIGGTGADVIAGGEGADILSGGSGADNLDGGLGADVLAGGAGDDVLVAGGGNDVLIGGLGSDILLGGEGDDVFLFTDASLIGGTAGVDVDTLDGGIGFDTLYLALGDAQRTLFEATGDLAQIGIIATGIDEVILLDSRLDLAQVASDARLEEADLWGLV